MRELKTNGCTWFRLNGGEPTMRELEMWMPEDDGGCAIEDDDLTSSNGWNANDMFAKVMDDDLILKIKKWLLRIAFTSFVDLFYFDLDPKIRFVKKINFSLNCLSPHNFSFCRHFMLIRTEEIIKKAHLNFFKVKFFFCCRMKRGLV